MEHNLEFSEKTAQNYMKIFANKNALKNETVSFLKEAYQSLIEHKPKQANEKRGSRIVDSTGATALPRHPWAIRESKAISQPSMGGNRDRGL